MNPEGWGQWADLLDLSADKLIAMANDPARGVDLSPNDHRNVINLLRHDYTSYDTCVRAARTDRIFNEILDEIAQDFPWLATQCEEDKRTHPSRLPVHAQARRSAHLDSVERQRLARQRVKLLAVSSKLSVVHRGKVRDGIVVRAGRTRVVIDVEMGDGRHETIDRSAADERLILDA